MISLQRMASDPLTNIRTRVLEAFKSGKLYSYDRQAPSGDALQTLASAKIEIESLIAESDKSPDAYRLLALIQESLMQYGAAIRTLELLVTNGMAKREDYKHLAMCRLALSELKTLPRQITDTDL